jgi:hypothetical protein
MSVVGLHDAVEEFSKNFERTSERQTPTLPVTKQILGVSKEFVNGYSKLIFNTFKADLGHECFYFIV